LVLAGKEGTRYGKLKLIGEMPYGSVTASGQKYSKLKLKLKCHRVP